MKLFTQLCELALMLAGIYGAALLAIAFERWAESVMDPRKQGRLTAADFVHEPEVLWRRAVDRAHAARIAIDDDARTAMIHCPFCAWEMFVRAESQLPQRYLAVNACAAHLVNTHPERLRGVSRDGESLATRV